MKERGQSGRKGGAVNFGDENLKFDEHQSIEDLTNGKIRKKAGGSQSESIGDLTRGRIRKK